MSHAPWDLRTWERGLYWTGLSLIVSTIWHGNASDMLQIISRFFNRANAL